jgi:predicted  nucleic acid-binding Zn-ribbon protein
MGALKDEIQALNRSLKDLTRENIRLLDTMSKSEGSERIESLNNQIKNLASENSSLENQLVRLREEIQYQTVAEKPFQAAAERDGAELNQRINELSQKSIDDLSG